MAILFHDNIQLVGVSDPTANNHVATKKYVDDAITNSGGGGSVSGRALTTALAPAHATGSSYVQGDYITYNDKLYQVNLSTWNGTVPTIAMMAGTSSLPEVNVGSKLKALETSLEGKAMFQQGTLAPQSMGSVPSGTIYFNQNTSNLYIRIGAGNVYEIELAGRETPLYITKQSVSATGSSVYFNIAPSKTIYTTSISANKTFVIDTTALEDDWTSGSVVTFEIIVTVTGSSDVTITWYSDVDWLGDATSDGTEITTLTHGRTYYFVFRSFDGPPAEWDDSRSEVRWIGNLQGSISNSAS